MGLNTVPQLVLQAIEGWQDAGPARCYLCGCACSGTRTTVGRILPTFTDRSHAAAPGSSALCAGCCRCLEEDAEVVLATGQRLRVRKAARRGFSWLIHRDSMTAFGRSAESLALLRRWCCQPPPPPFALVLTDAGTRHLLWRGVVCHEPSPITVTLEEEEIRYRPEELQERLSICTLLAAAAGKPALRQPPTPWLAIKVLDTLGEEHLAAVETWEKYHEEPLSRLAAWLCPGRDDARKALGVSDSRRGPDRTVSA